MTENSVTLFTNANKMLAEATTIQKAKELMDIALTAADWAKRKKLGEEAIQYARSYAFEAERRIGELLKATERSKGGEQYHKIPTGTKGEPVPTPHPPPRVGAEDLQPLVIVEGLGRTPARRGDE